MKHSVKSCYKINIQNGNSNHSKIFSFMEQSEKNFNNM